MKKLKKFIALSLASIFCVGTASVLAGCDGEKTDSGNLIYSITSLSNAYIVVNENGVDTLHKGTLIERAWGNSYGGAMTPILKFNCGKELQTSQFIAYTQGCPSEEKYDEVCDCAREVTLVSNNTSQKTETAERSL